MKSTFPKISLVTPSFNQAKFLEKTILSILSQNYPNLEYFIIDGGSTDGSVEIIKKYEKHLTYWESKKDRGQAHAINKGFQRSTGKIMAWLNSDDVYLPGALQLVASIFESVPEVSWVTSNPSTITPDGYINHLARTPVYSSYLIRNGWYIRKLLGFIMQEGTFWRRELWEKAGASLVESATYTMDLELWRSFAHHSRLVPITACLASYRLNPQRKNNDLHQKYYNEMGYTLQEPAATLVKFLWRQYEDVLNYMKITESIYFSEKKQSWIYRDNKKAQTQIKNLSFD